ncbi:hypothetical protein M434DRAFT_393983 [Hypoxylon sp. CO27-5]|nr:hypothetical protein M434DRAFT_393983 [Hypoxylon sp. CO27-5]
MLPIISIIGMPAGGKETLGKELADDFDLYHLSIMDMLRSIKDPSQTVAEYIRGESLPFELKEYLSRWRYIPINDMINYLHLQRRSIPLGFILVVLRKKIEEITKRKKHRGILLDDFPRRAEHARGAAELFGSPFPDLTIVIECPFNVARSRYLRRPGFGDRADYFQDRLHDFWKRMPDLLQELKGSEMMKHQIRRTSRGPPQ